jgi:hypothetical protein
MGVKFAISTLGLKGPQFGNLLSAKLEPGSKRFSAEVNIVGVY